MPDDELIPMRVDRVILDPSSQLPIVVLRDESGSRALPIWIGAFEASAIAMAREGMKPPRPMTHDLFATVLGALEARVERVVVTEVRDSTYYARLFLRAGGEVREVDSRPSDAIALAVRTDAPIFVSPKVAETAIRIEDYLDKAKAEKYREFLERIDPEEFSRYKM